jgi:decaprenylphospho-beta-D-ribofuranose 2-oxidase
MKKTYTKFSGFGNILKTYSVVNQDFFFTNEKIENVAPVKIAIRGKGNAYGDAATNDQGSVFLVKRLPKFIELNKNNGICKVSANMSIGEVITFLEATDWSISVAPGSGSISIGGCVASDVHGKNHTSAGSFANVTKKIFLILPNGTKKILTKPKSKLWKSTFGGMGLTGLITEVELQLEKTKCKRFITQKYFTESFQETIDYLSQLNEKEKSYLLAWTDFTNKDKFGRSIIYRSHRCQIRCEPTQMKKLKTVPSLPMSIVNRTTSRALNLSKFHIEKLLFTRTKQIQSLPEHKVLFPSDLAKKWNRVFGPSGLMEYQFIFPIGREKEAEKILRDLALKIPPALAAIKIFGIKNENYLSFPSEGFAVGITFPWKKKYLKRITEVDEKISNLGFKKYLSKDLYTHGAIIHQMYPQLKEFLKLKKTIDPQNILESDLLKRIQLNEWENVRE